MNKIIMLVCVFVCSMASAVASTAAPSLDSCKKEVAVATVQLINAISVSETKAELDVKPGEIEHDGKSSTVYLIPASVGGADVMTAGNDDWVAPVHRSVGHTKDTFVVGATTQTNRAGECRVLSMTVLDHITGR